MIFRTWGLFVHSLLRHQMSIKQVVQVNVTQEHSRVIRAEPQQFSCSFMSSRRYYKTEKRRAEWSSVRNPVPRRVANPTSTSFPPHQDFVPL